MLDYIIGFIIIFGYIGLAVLLSLYIYKRTKNIRPYLRQLILSLFYSCIFGIGLAGGGGDPGFAIPCPIILAGIFDIWAWTNIKSFLSGVIIPFIFWWTLIFIVLLIINMIGILKKKRKNN